jgi:hypothetical protein
MLSVRNTDRSLGRQKPGAAWNGASSFRGISLQSQNVKTVRERCRGRSAAPMGQCAENPVQHFIKTLSNIFRKDGSADQG